MTSAFVSAFVLAFSTFLPVINPFSGAMFFCTLTTSLSDRDRAFVANRIALYCLIILLVCLTCGHLILSFFGISVGVLRMAGGCVLFAAGWTALNAPTQEETTEERPALSRAKLKSMAFYPYTLPLTTGPGAIAVSVAVSTSLPRDLGHIAGTFVATVATVLGVPLKTPSRPLRASRFTRLLQMRVLPPPCRSAGYAVRRVWFCSRTSLDVLPADGWHSHSDVW